MTFDFCEEKGHKLPTFVTLIVDQILKDSLLPGLELFRQRRLELDFDPGLHLFFVSPKVSPGDGHQRAIYLCIHWIKKLNKTWITKTKLSCTKYVKVLVDGQFDH